MKKQRRNAWISKTVKWLLMLSALLLITVVWSVSTGSAQISFMTVWKIIWSKLLFFTTWIDGDWKVSQEAIVWKIRLPRVLLAGLVGMGLAVAGTAFQGVLRNPLADPYILGVSSGAALGAAVVILLGWQSQVLGAFSLPFVAFVMAMLTLFLVYRVAYSGQGMGMETMILAGVVVQSFAGALLSFILAISEFKMQQIVYWLMGSLALTHWEYSGAVLPFVIIGMLVIWGFSRELNIFALGEQSARHMGVSVDRIRMILLIVASLITGAVVSVSGTIGFAGLIVPHIMRLLVGTDHRILIPISALAGAIFLIAADTLARTVMAPQELPIGVITAFLGAPFFAYLLRKRKKTTYV